MKTDRSRYIQILRSHFQLDAEEYLDRLTDHFINAYLKRRYPRGYCFCCNRHFRD